MKNTEVLVIGGGPAGINAALAASQLGAKVLLCERDGSLGGQLIKQSCKFFGSEYAGLRGFEIGGSLLKQIEAEDNIEVWLDCTVLGIYDDGVVTCDLQGKHVKVKPERIIVATGAAEKHLAFAGNDLPGVFSAGAAETLIEQGVKPARRALMVGAGNIGLTVSYQMKQVGVDVAAVVEAMPRIGGYLVHAARLRRAGVPIMTGYTIVEAHGNGQVEGACIAKLDDNGKVVPGTMENIDCDAVCLAVGLSPLADLCWQAGCRMRFIRELSGHVPLVNDDLETSVKGLYVAGDVSGLEEATTALGEGRLAGLAAAASLGYGADQAAALMDEARAQLQVLREGPLSAKIRNGLAKAQLEGGVADVD